MEKIFLEKLYIKNFRNLNEGSCHFSPGINCIFGKNGNGKTNLLEAIYYQINRRSFRKKAFFPQLKNHNVENSDFIIKTLFKKEDEPLQFSLKVTEKESLFFLNSKRIRKKSNIPIIIISPFDSFLFFNKTSERRDWFNLALSDIDPDYKKTLGDYTKALRMRNTLLSKFYGPEDQLYQQLTSYDRILAKTAVFLINARVNFLEAIKSKIEENFKRIFNKTHIVKLSYISKFTEKNEEEIFQIFQEGTKIDRLHKTTKRGVHLDDYQILIDGQPANEFGSVGQQKVSYLSLLFSHVGYLEERVKILPILLIDDISGELDSICWKNLLSYLETRKLQVFITTANSAFEEELGQISDGNKILVDNGQLRELTQ